MLAHNWFPYTIQVQIDKTKLRFLKRDHRPYVFTLPAVFDLRKVSNIYISTPPFRLWGNGTTSFCPGRVVVVVSIAYSKYSKKTNTSLKTSLFYFSRIEEKY